MTRERSARTVPCATCPWRVGADASLIPGLDVDRARALDATCPADDSQPYGPPLMACHGSPEGADQVCIGWAVSDASRDSIPLRLAMRDGVVAGWRVLRDACDRAGVIVYDSFAAMLAQIEATADDDSP